MSKQTKLLSFFLFLVIATSLIFLFLDKDIENEKSKNVSEDKYVSQEDISNAYKKDIKIFVGDFLFALDNVDFSADKARNARNQLVSMTVPTDLRDLHLAIFKAVTKIEDSLVGGNREGIPIGKKEIEEIISEYSLFN